MKSEKATQILLLAAGLVFFLVGNGALSLIFAEQRLYLVKCNKNTDYVWSVFSLSGFSGIG